MEDQAQKENLIHPLSEGKPTGIAYESFFLVLVLVILTGGVAGFFLAKARQPASSGSQLSSAKAKEVVGVADKKTFRDKAEGVLKEGGVDGEGNFHLERPGGPSQNVYLTSTTVDLSQYIGKKVRVWGETFQAEKAGWLMDVGLVEIL